MRKHILVVALAGLAGITAAAHAQDPGSTVLDSAHKHGGSTKVHALAHVDDHSGHWKAANVEIEQDANRPYVYLSGFVNYDAQIYDISNLAKPKLIYRWAVEHPELHRGLGAMDGKYFKIGSRYYYAQSYQFMQGSPDADLGAVIFDVTGLPDTSKVKIVARIRYPQALGGFHNTFAYKHSDGRVLYFVVVNDTKSVIYDLGKIVAGTDPASAIVGAVPNPTPLKQVMAGGYHDFYVAYDPNTHQDKFYGAGLGGFSVWDVSHPETPKELFTITSFGQDVAHTFTPSPDGKYAVTETEYQYTPLRIWDLTDGQSGKLQNIDTPIGAWTPDWRDLVHNHEVRWPYVFVSAYEDGLQIFNLKDPSHPQTEGYYFTCDCVHQHGFGNNPDNGWQGTSVMQGAFGVDVRNRDGLIVISDMNSGLWMLKMDGFKGWNGRDYGVPNISSVQDYDNGPVGKPMSMLTPATPAAPAGH
jgi:hypothetical protein